MPTQHPKDNAKLQGILKTLRNEMPRLEKTYHVKSLGVFGPYARGEADGDSQVDILVEYKEAPGFLRFFDLETELSKLVGAQVHLVSKGGPKGERLRRILDESVAV